MRQLTFIKPGHLEWWDVPAPQLESSVQALVRPIAVASCDIDASIIKGAVPFPGPFAFGHEFIAEVIAVGEDVHLIAPGQIVAVPFQISCGTCDYCRRGLTGNCRSVKAFASYGLGRADWGGAFSDVVRVPFADHMLVPVPSGIPLATIASASDNLPDAWRTVGPPLQELPGANVLVIGGAGSGSIGLYAVAIAKALGASQVDYVDSDSRRLEIANTLGASIIERRETLPKRLGLYPITVDSGGNAHDLARALRSTAPDGICTSTGIYFGHEIPFPLQDMYYSGITFKTGRPHARIGISEVFSLVRDSRLHPEQVTTEIARWEEAPEALQNFHTKLVITRE